jgi:hypothetical protein
VQRVLAVFIAFITNQILARLIAKPRALSLFKLTSKLLQANTGLAVAFTRLLALQINSKTFNRSNLINQALTIHNNDAASRIVVRHWSASNNSDWMVVI